MTGSMPVSALATNSSTTSSAIQIPTGFTLVGVEIPVELTSTTFTLMHCNKIDGTYTTLKDPLGVYTASASDAVTFTIGSTSLGSFLIPPAVSALLFSYVKVILGSSETGVVNLIFKDLA